MTAGEREHVCCFVYSETSREQRQTAPPPFPPSLPHCVLSVVCDCVRRYVGCRVSSLLCLCCCCCVVVFSTSTSQTGLELKRERERERVPPPTISVQLRRLFYWVVIVIIIIFRVHMVNGKYSYKKEYENKHVYY